MGSSLYNKIPLGRRSELLRLRACQVLAFAATAMLLGAAGFFLAA